MVSLAQPVSEVAEMAAIRAAAPIFRARDSDLFNFSFSLDLDVHSSPLCLSPIGHL